MSAKECALKIILRRRQSGKQIYEKLLEKGFEENEAEEAVSYYKEKGYIDDKDYARRFTSDAIKIKGHGKSRIIRDLKTKGISDEDIEEVLSDAFFELAPIMLKKFPACESIKEKNKIINHFLRKGFSFGEINDALRENYPQEF